MTANLDDARRRATRAQRELDETNGAFNMMRESAVKAWLSSKSNEAEHREELYRAVQTIDAVRSYLMQIVDGAKVADFADTLRKEGYQP